MKNIRYHTETLLLHILFFFFGILPIDMASGMGGGIARFIGPRLGASRKARRNLENALPGLTDKQYNVIIADMWDNLGRVLAEYPHLKEIALNRTEVSGTPVMENLIKNNRAAVFFGGHIGNWEINCPTTYLRFKKPIGVTYRALNNPYADALLMKARTLNGTLPAYPKARSTGRELIEAIKENRWLGTLIDQKYNEGIPVPFFGMDAMTNPAFVLLCQKYNCPLVPVQNERLEGARFRLTVHPPLNLFDDNGKPLLPEQVLQEAHILLENWITQSPGQWLWLHRRWDSKRLTG